MDELGVFIRGIFIADEFKASNDPQKPGNWRISLQIGMQSFVITMDSWQHGIVAIGEVILVKVTPWNFDGRTGYSHGQLISEV